MKLKITILFTFVILFQIYSYKVIGNVPLLQYSDNSCFSSCTTTFKTEGFLQTDTGCNITLLMDNSTGILTINFKEDKLNYTVDVYDITGNFVAKNITRYADESSVVVKINSAAKGIYIVRLSTVSTTITKKIILS